MKSEAGTFGFDVLLTFLLPGFIVAIAMLLFHTVDGAAMDRVLEQAVKAQFLAAFVLLAVITLLGVVVASAQAVIETYVLDHLTARLVKQQTVEYNLVWQKYVSNLPKLGNRYISRLVLFFQFETRLGLALVVLGAITWYVSGSHTSVALVSESHALAFVVVGVGLYCIGEIHHVELARCRRDLISDMEKAEGDLTVKRSY